MKKIVDTTKATAIKGNEESSFANAAAKAKANTKDKAEMQNFDRKMVGDIAKFLCDKCDYTANSNRAVKTHWAKKHRREVQEEEEIKTGGKPSETAEAKKLKPDEEKTEIDLLDLYDDDGNPLDETADLTTPDYSIMETQDTQDFDTSTPMKSSTEDDDMNIKRAENESLKESLNECKELLNIANAKISSLEEDGIKKNNKIDKYVRITNKLREKQPDGDANNMKKELNEAKKTIKKLNERLQDNMKKVRDETNQRAKAEAEGRVKDSTISALKEVLAR